MCIYASPKKGTHTHTSTNCMIVSGIIRNAGATYHSAWQAYEVHDLTYKMMVLESMDNDTETRRLSPIAVLGSPTGALTDRYIDLINGPQDHGWCFGYTCRKRLSTFPILVATGEMTQLITSHEVNILFYYIVFFSSTALLVKDQSSLCDTLSSVPLSVR